MRAYPDDSAQRRDVRAILGLARETGLTDKELLEAMRQRADDDAVPISIFKSDALSPLEAIVKYLHENRGVRISHIAQRVGRDQRNIDATYRRTKEKVPGPFPVEDVTVLFPLSLLKDRRLSVFEHLVVHLLAQKYSQSEIAELTRRDPRTIWTIASRAQRKSGRPRA